MGLFHTRASKQRDRAQARLLNAQRADLRRHEQADLAGQPWYRQPTLGEALGQLLLRRRQHTG